MRWYCHCKYELTDLLVLRSAATEIVCPKCRAVYRFQQPVPAPSVS